MNQIGNSTKIEMLCELAHNRVKKAEDSLISKGNGTTLIIENKGEGQYTELGQNLFDEWYDYYESIILNYLKEK
jgi:hypothetical protein